LVCPGKAEYGPLLRQALTRIEKEKPPRCVRCANCSTASASPSTRAASYERFFPLYEAADTFFYSPADVTATGAHVRDAMDLKRMMILVVIAALPCVFMAFYNTGLQANLAIDPAKAAALEGWRHAVIRLLGVGYSPDSFMANVVHGGLYFLPLYIVTMVVGLGWEVMFSVVRKIEVNEGFFVTGMLFPLILPPTTPLWQAALA
jgi:Na+-transporting NADH:ubiquinone oxidoreductase subunit B